MGSAGPTGSATYPCRRKSGDSSSVGSSTDPETLGTKQRSARPAHHKPRLQGSAPCPLSWLLADPEADFPGQGSSFLERVLVFSSNLHVDVLSAASSTPGVQGLGDITEPAFAISSRGELRLVKNRSAVGSGSASVSGKIAPRPDPASTFLPCFFHRLFFPPAHCLEAVLRYLGVVAGSPALLPWVSRDPSPLLSQPPHFGVVLGPSSAVLQASPS